MKALSSYLPAIILLALLLVLNYHFYDFVEADRIPLFFIIKVLLVFALLTGLLVILVNLARSGKRGNIQLSLISAVFAILILETVFTFIARSHHAEITYASIIWQKRYYHLNESGFRDGDLETKTKDLPALVFSGDSYTAGYGLNSKSMRFSDITGNALEGKFEFYNLGLKATGPLEHFKYPAFIENKKKIFIYQVFINDLDDFCGRQAALYDIYSNFSSLDKYWARSLFLLNYIYFSFPNDEIMRDYYQFFESCSSNREIYDTYIATLKKELKNLKENFGYEEVILLPMPTLGDLSFSEYFDKTISSALNELPFVKIVDVRSMVMDLPLGVRIVNRQDTHASKEVNRLIAQELLSLLGEENPQN